LPNHETHCMLDPSNESLSMAKGFFSSNYYPYW
jgi:hypothetical protein